MPFDIKFGHHFKRYNSTSQPDTSGWYHTEAVWKNSQDIDNPTWHIQESTVSDLLDWNYAYLPEHNAYYWITSIVSVGNNRWQISATMDVLATYKQAIMDTPGMIEYGFNVDASGAQYRLPDQRQNVSQVPTVATAKADITGGAINKEFGSYVLTAVGKQGGVTAYALSLYDIRGLLNSVGKDIGDAISELTSMEEIFKYFTANGIYQGNAISAIRNCTWMPLRLNIFEGDIQPVYLGDFDTTRTDFNPLAPRGARPYLTGDYTGEILFQSTSSSRSQTTHPAGIIRKPCDFNPLAPRGARRFSKAAHNRKRMHFNPLAPRGARRIYTILILLTLRFQSTSSSRSQTNIIKI